MHAHTHIYPPPFPPLHLPTGTHSHAPPYIRTQADFEFAVRTSLLVVGAVLSVTLDFFKEVYSHLPACCSLVCLETHSSTPLLQVVTSGQDIVVAQGLVQTSAPTIPPPG